MKANAPEKVYMLKHIDYSDRRILNVFTEKENNNDIEYTRTDAFIEKAEGWLREFQKGFILTDKDITDFINYMKGE